MAAGLIGTIAILRFGLVGLGARALFAGWRLTALTARFLGLTKLRRFALSGLLLPVRWGAKLVSQIPWAVLTGGKFVLSGLLAPVRWGARLVSRIPWTHLAGGLKWSSLIKPLSWLGRGALRFIPVIGWASLAGELVWRLLIKPLGWDKYLPIIDWTRVWNSFSWEGWLPEVNWSEFVSAISWPDWVKGINWSALINPIEWSDYLPLINWAKRLTVDWSNYLTPLAWRDYLPIIDWKKWVSFNWKTILDPLKWPDLIPSISWSNWFSFAWSDLLPKWDWGAIIPQFNLGSSLFFGSAPSGSSKNPDERSAAVRRGQFLGYAREVTPVVGARAKGGPIKAGLPYLAGELGPEPIFSSQAAFVATHNQLQIMQRAARGIRSAGLAAATVATVSLPALAMPAAAAPAGGFDTPASSPRGGGVDVRLEIGSISITAPSGVSDPEGLVNLLEQRLGDRLGAALAASFSD